MIQLNINHPLSSLDVLQVLLDAEGSELSNGLHAPEIVATDVLPDLLFDLAHVEGGLRLLAHDLQDVLQLVLFMLPCLDRQGSAEGRFLGGVLLGLVLGGDGNVVAAMFGARMCLLVFVVGIE